jgi:hypothetical protein
VRLRTDPVPCCLLPRSPAACCVCCLLLSRLSTRLPLLLLLLLLGVAACSSCLRLSDVQCFLLQSHPPCQCGQQLVVLLEC